MEPFLLATAYSVLGLVLVWTSVIDIRTREVPDWLSAGLLLFAAGFATVVDSAVVMGWSLLGSSLLLLVFLGAWFLDGFVFFPRVAGVMERLPWWGQFGVSSGICVLAFVAAGLLDGVAPTIARSLAGASLGYLIGVGLYWSRQWGGGDAKLLAGVGAVLGFDLAYVPAALGGSVLPAPSFLLFLVLLLISGAFYGAAWLGVLAIVRRKTFVPAFRTTLGGMRTLRYCAWGATALVLALAVYASVRLDPSFGVYLVVLAALVYTGFYLVVAVRAAERSLMTAPRKPGQLVPGDWVLGPVVVGTRVLVPKASAGVTEREIAALRKAAPAKTVLVRQGVPFVPSFLIAFLILAALRWWVFS